MVASMTLFASTAFAQLTNTDTTDTGNYAGGSGAQVTVTMTATLGNAIELDLDGATAGATPTTITPTGGATGTVAFGGFDTMCNGGVTTGRCIRTATGTLGAHLVAAFTATVSFSGAASADLGITRNAAAGASPPDVAAANLKFASGVATDWTASGAGAALPAPLAVGGDTNLGAALTSGTAVTHEVAMFFADTSTAGAYSSTVRWTATTN
jgi:hypothetical protein